MNQKQNILHMLSEIKDNIDSKNREEIYSSTTNVKSILERFYSKESIYFIELKGIRQQVHSMVAYKVDKAPLGPELSELKKTYYRLLESIIREVELLGVPSNNDTVLDKSVKVNVNQQQNQEQSQSIQLSLFLEFIKDDITGKQYKELVYIAKNENDPETAKPKIIEKLKSFGENICTNIVTNILTNPTIWSMMAG